MVADPISQVGNRCRQTCTTGPSDGASDIASCGLSSLDLQSPPFIHCLAGYNGEHITNDRHTAQIQPLSAGGWNERDRVVTRQPIGPILHKSQVVMDKT